MSTVSAFRLRVLWILLAVFAAGCGAATVTQDAGSDSGGGTDVLVAPDRAAPDAPAVDASTACSLPVQRALATPTDSVTATLAGASRNASTTCTTMTGTGGPEHFYTLHLAARTGVILRVDAAIDTMIAVRTACDAPLSEVACNDNAPGEARNPAVRTVLDAGDYFVLVDQIGFGVGGAYTLTLETFTPAANASCASPTMVTAGAHLTAQDTQLGTAPSTACLPTASGAVLHYAVAVPAGNRLTVRATPTGAAWAPVVRVVSQCTSTSCLAQSSPLRAGAPVPAAYVNPTTRDVTLLVAVGSGTAGTFGTFDLDVTVEPPPANVDCAMATPVMDGTLLPDESTALAHDVITACAPAATGRVRYYDVTIPANSVLVATATSASTGIAAPVLRMLPSCGATTCLASATTPFAPSTGLRYVSGATPLHAILAVGDDGRSADFHYSFAVSIRPAPANATCAAPRAVADGTVLRGEDLTSGGAALAACSMGTEGPTLYYATTVPANNRLVVSAASRGGLAAFTIQLAGSCAATTCLGVAALGAPLIFNNGPTAQPVLIAVTAANGGPTSPFDLTVAITPPAVTAICATATAVTDGTVLRAQSTDDGRDTLTACPFASGGPTPGPVLYYTATVPAGQVLVATATPNTAMGRIFNPLLRLIPSCGSTTCLGTSETMFFPPTGLPSSVAYTNAGTTAQTVFIAVGTDLPGMGGLFDLAVALHPPAVNGRCTMATPVADGAALRGQLITDGVDTVTACLPTATGRSLFFRATIPAGFALAARMTNTASGMFPGGWVPVLRVLATCTATTCLASGTSTPMSTGTTTSVTYANAGAAPMDVILAAGSDTAGATGTFSLDVSITRPPYVESTTPAACDDMATAAVSPVTGDDAAGPITALPFALAFFGEPNANYSLTTNGAMQLLPASGGTASALLPSMPIPSVSPAGPSRIVAPFWDDLYVDAASDLRTRTVGAAPARHFTVQWTNARFFSDGGERMTFQAKFFETTNVIEFHYCALTPPGSPRVTGGQNVTVGLQNATGLVGVQHSHGTPGSVSTAAAIRFTPSS